MIPINGVVGQLLPLFPVSLSVFPEDACHRIHQETVFVGLYNPLFKVFKGDLMSMKAISSRSGYIVKIFIFRGSRAGFDYL